MISCFQEKFLNLRSIACTKTDTGRWVEYTKVSERTLVKELGKMDP